MFAYEYDGAGNLTTVRARNSMGPVAVEYTYTNDGLLHTANCGGTTTVTNTWDAMGNRVGLDVNGTSYTLTYDVRAGVPAVIQQTGGGKTYYYFRDPSGVLIARFDVQYGNPSPWRYYHYDELGSTRLLTDSDGDVTDEYAYDAYSGNTITHLGITHDNPYQWVGALGYYTHYQAPDFKLIQLGFRFYDPQTSRFTQQDPIGYGVNWYAYCAGNPFGVDPWGLLSLGDVFGFIDGGGHKGDWIDQIIDFGSNFGSGAGDVISMGWTEDVRRNWDVDSYVDYDSFTHGMGRGFGRGWQVASVATAGAVVGTGIRNALAAGAAGFVTVTHWYPNGADGTLDSGMWVVRGGQNLWTYLMSGATQRGYPYGNAVTVQVPAYDLSNPGGWERLKAYWPWLQQIYNGGTIRSCSCGR